MIKIILASSSPRRKHILSILRIPFTAISPDIDETVFENNDIIKTVKACSKQKVSAIKIKLNENKWIAGFDTLVELNNKILGKPKNRNEAENMLKLLSNRTHKVHTGIAITNDKDGEIITDSCTTEVKLISMSNKDIEFYLNTKEWNGVAGAYRIQERGAFFINSINGSYSNVVGLPISLFYGMLCQYNFPFKE